MQQVVKNKKRIYDLITTALSISLVFVSTLLLNIRLPIVANGGLVHLGTAMLFILAILFGPKKGAIIGALGMGLFDLFSGWVIWAPITFIARGLQGYIVGRIAWSLGKKGLSIRLNLVAVFVSTPVMIACYYFGEALIFNSLIVPIASIPGDIIQNLIGVIIAIPVVKLLAKTSLFKK